MLRIVGAWLVVAMLALLWHSSGIGTASSADLEGTFVTAIDSPQSDSPDHPYPVPEPQSGDDGEAEPDAGASMVSAKGRQVASAARQSGLTITASPFRHFAAYRSQAPPLD